MGADENNSSTPAQEAPPALNGIAAVAEEEIKQQQEPEEQQQPTESEPTDAQEAKEQQRPSNTNEDRKIFVGGIAYDVTNEDLAAHFATYGEVKQAQVKYDRTTGRSRGFAFVEFDTSEACKTALQHREQTIKNKACEIKPAKSREVNKKVFVGGLPSDFPEDELRKHFEEFGKVEDIEWPFDKQTKARRNFAFIVFEEEESADKAANVPRQTFGSREADVKKAVPQNRRNFFYGAARLPMGPIRGFGFGTGLRGPYGQGMHSSPWFGSSLANGWPPMSSMPYGAGSTTGSTWGDWYGGASSGASFFGGSHSSSANHFGAYGSTNGYDHQPYGHSHQGSSLGSAQSIGPRHGQAGHGHAGQGPQHQSGAQVNGSRYSQPPQQQQQQF